VRAHQAKTEVHLLAMTVLVVPTAQALAAQALAVLALDYRQE
jgi:hypothetical protein